MSEKNRKDKEHLFKIEKKIVVILQEVLFLAEEEIDVHKTFNEYGADSILSVEIINKLNKKLSLNVQATALYNYPTVSALSQYLFETMSSPIDTGNSSANTLLESTVAVKFNKKDVSSTIDSSEKHEIKLNLSSLSDDANINFSAEQKPVIKTPYLDLESKPVPQKLQDDSDNNDIAIIGVSLEFPGSKSLSSFWKSLSLGESLITEIPNDRWAIENFYSLDVEEKNSSISKWGGFLSDVAEFDSLFFNISPAEAEWMDPQQRLFLKHCWSAVEDAGYALEMLRESKCGVYAGVMNQDYQQLLAQKNIGVNHYAVTGNSLSILAGRVAHYLNLQGPTLTVDTACSSSLVAMHLAMNAIRNRETDLMLVGGVTLWLSPSSYIGMSQAGMLSKDGACKTFDSHANGFVPGEGIGVVLLKRFEHAKRDGDHIYAVIKGSGINQDGYTNGITAPNGVAQTKLEKEIYQRYQIDVENISYLEAHGTGTKLGDPVEMLAAMDAFKEFTSKKQFCAVGSVKTNIGHTAAAAGMASLIKVLLCLKHKKIVPSLNFKIPNEHIPFTESPFYVNTALVDWKQALNKPRCAAISSFGFSGTNAHMIVSEVARPEITKDIKPYYLITLSAKTLEALQQKQKDLLAWLATNEFSSLSAISYTLNVGRNHFNYRNAWVVDSTVQLQTELQLAMQSKASEHAFSGVLTKHSPPDDVVIYEEVFEGIVKKMQQLDEQDHKQFYKNLRVIANLYVKGYVLDWKLLYRREKIQRLSLPVYPFAKEKHWFPEENAKGIEPSRKNHFLIKTWEPSPQADILDGIVPSIIVYDQKTFQIANQLKELCKEFFLIEASQIHTLLNKDLTMYSAWIDLSAMDFSLRWIVVLQRWIEFKRFKNITLLQVTMDVEALQNAAISLDGSEKIGLYRMLQSEYAGLHSRHLDLTSSMSLNLISTTILKELQLNNNDVEACYRDGVRYVPSLKIKDISLNQNFRNPIQFSENDVLLITGGTRGIGLLAAKNFAKRYNVKQLVLIGREQIPERKQWGVLDEFSDSIKEKIKQIRELEALGATVHVFSLPLENYNRVQLAFDHIKQSIGPIRGVVHAAGTVDFENLAFVNKSIENIQMLLSPKIQGLKNIVKAIDKHSLQFMILFSSVSSIIPTLSNGKSDYAMANAFMDYFSSFYHQFFPIVSVQWPSWKETGFGEVTTAAYQKTGFFSITNEEGLNFFDEILGDLSRSVIMPVVVDGEKFSPGELLLTNNQKKVVVSNNEIITQSDFKKIPDVMIIEEVKMWLKTLFEKELKLKNGTLNTDLLFQDYGIDSIFLAQIHKIINKTLNIDMDFSIFFEKINIDALAEYLWSTYPEKKFGNVLKNREVENVIPNASLDDKNFETSSFTMEQDEKKMFYSRSKDIAVVGMSCKFPGANHLEDYWKLLEEGRSAIAQVPENCWGMKTKYYAGLIEGIYNFDPDFFKIAAEDAAKMDPQALLLLLESLKVIYHAGYQQNEVNGSVTGVYIGARTSHYVRPKSLSEVQNPIMVLGQNYLAANISQFFNFKGPALVVDTACSSALTAMNMAVEALQMGKIESAIVGGVSLLNGPFTHQVFEKRDLLQKEGEFHILDQRASGTVLGEGVGAVYLKPLELAEKDGDTIYAVISGVSINNDGKTLGHAVPNIEAQKEVMRNALEQSECEAHEVQLIEVNGSGSLVTDLLEIKAIEAVYRKEISKPCYLGSMKPNIGHPLCAQGIASFIKTCLVLHQQNLPPFLSGKEPLQHYSMKDKNFIFIRKSQKTSLNYAALNSFADGGTNAHVILKKYQKLNAGNMRSPLIVPAMNLLDVRTLSCIE